MGTTQQREKISHKEVAQLSACRQLALILPSRFSATSQASILIRSKPNEFVTLYPRTRTRRANGRSSDARTVADGCEDLYSTPIASRFIKLLREIKIVAAEAKPSIL